MGIFQEEDILPIAEKFLITKQEACKLLSISLSTLDRLIKQNAIPYKTMGSRILFYPPELKEWAAKLPNGDKL
ncbi:MAG: excisionase family DNA-binding protein [Opitutae bacterium]